jgi:hypothetical protein
VVGTQRSEWGQIDLGVVVHTDCPALRRLRQKTEFKTSLNYIVRPCLKRPKEIKESKKRTERSWNLDINLLISIPHLWLSSFLNLLPARKLFETSHFGDFKKVFKTLFLLSLCLSVSGNIMLSEILMFLVCQYIFRSARQKLSSQIFMILTLSYLSFLVLLLGQGS